MKTLFVKTYNTIKTAKNQDQLKVAEKYATLACKLLSEEKAHWLKQELQSKKIKMRKDGLW